MEIVIYALLVFILILMILLYRKVMDTLKEIKQGIGDLKYRSTSSDNRQYEIIEHLRTLKQQNTDLQDKVFHTHKVATNTCFGDIADQYVDYIYHSNRNHHDLQCTLDILTTDPEAAFLGVRIKDFRTDQQFAKDIEFLKDQYLTLELARVKWGL